MSDWIKCEEKLPPMNKRVLIYAIHRLDNSPLITITRMSDVNIINTNLKTTPYWVNPFQYFTSNYTITHWMDLPEPPKENKMSNIEHLIENAITCLEENRDFDYFISMWQNKEMLKYVNATPEEIWEMAIYVVTTYKDGIVWDTEDKIEKKYGYPIPEE